MLQTTKEHFKEHLVIYIFGLSLKIKNVDLVNLFNSRNVQMGFALHGSILVKKKRCMYSILNKDTLLSYVNQTKIGGEKSI